MIPVHYLNRMERNTDEHRGPRIGSTNQLIITWLLYKRPRNLMKAAGPLVERLISLLHRCSQARPSASASARSVR